MRGRLGVAGVPSWLAFYALVGVAAWGVPMVLIAWCDSMGARTPWIGSIGRRIDDLQPIFILGLWAGACLWAAWVHKRAWLALVGPWPAIVGGGVLASYGRMWLGLSGPPPSVWSEIRAVGSCCGAPAVAVSLIGWLIAAEIWKKGECPHCGYSKVGLPSDVCPECGGTTHPRTSVRREGLAPGEASGDQGPKDQA